MLHHRALHVAAVGAAVALAGAYWDDAWHTTSGRDSALIAPHLMIYGGIAVVAAVIALRRQGDLGAWAVAATLASGPIDATWHEAFGRDAVLWSPPHLLGIAGTVALGAVVLAELRSALAAGLVLAAATFPVAEYETDVPQFADVWFLPVLAAGMLLAFELAARAGVSAVRAAAVHLAFMVPLALALPSVALPLLLVPAFVLDRTGSRAAAVLALYAIYVPARELPAEVLLALPAVALAAAGLDLRRSTALAVALLAAAAPAALAHDPGQGEDAGTAHLVVEASGHVRAEFRGLTCAAYTHGRVVARRGGRTLTAPARLRGCELRGRLALPHDGRWFVYAELARARKGPGPSLARVETWLPVEPGERAEDRARYVYVPPPERAVTGVQIAGGALLYGAVAALLAAALRRRA